ncbi:beta-lactamase/transpeptidase-like protein [Polychaeton citri CBS 116435]|uniref:Beta-lactamase/transpeptidase-like protein n=1 Tax=Polychaeton citri CBS 116435 TaxID=1314669 RepID=A0A9P4Q0C0_9PEZI|nr:beta-lactamase/transpeptidase-like protein [Polychaeton citri CBS 116435]
MAGQLHADTGKAGGNSSTVNYEDLGDAKLDVFVEDTLARYHTTGLSIAVVHGDKTWAKGYGYSDISANEKVTPRTLFLAASTTKSFTAALLAHIVESKDPQYSDVHGRPITWQTRVGSLLPNDFVLHDEHTGSRVTVEDALSHRTGLPRHDLAWTAGDSSTRDQIRKLRHLPLHNELRAAFEYTNLPFKAIAHAAAEVAGAGSKPKDLYKKWIFDPLGMRETFFDLEEARQHAVNHCSVGANFSRGYYWAEETQSQFEAPWETLPPRDGSGGIISNVLDYTIWMRHLMSKYIPIRSSKPDKDGEQDENSQPGLGKATVAAMTTPRIVLPSPLLTCHKGVAGYGLGLYVYTYRDNLVWQHNGGISGYMCSMIMLPEKNWAIMTMQNSYSFAEDVVIYKLIDDFLGLQGDARWDMESHVQSLEKDIKAKLRHENIVKRLYPDAPMPADAIPPRLELELHEGVYSHPAYHSFRLYSKPHEDDEPGEGLLYLRPASKAYLDIKFTLRHVSGEWWWAYKQTGPKQWLADTVHKVRFELGINGELKAMWLQAEPAIEDLASFEKIKCD